MKAPEKGTTWKSPEGHMAAVENILPYEDHINPENSRTLVGVIWLNLPKGMYLRPLIPLDNFNANMTQMTIIAVEKQHRNPWEVYLADRADGCKGHFAIARWNPAGHQEVWNLRKHMWAACSDDVLTLEEAEKMLRTISFHPMTPSIRCPV